MRVKISAKSQNLGFGWSSVPSGKGTEIVPPDKPMVTGGLQSIEREMEFARKLNNSNFWVGMLFVGESPVVKFEQMVYIGPKHVEPHGGRPSDFSKSEYWQMRMIPVSIVEILDLLREGETVTVEIDDPIDQVVEAVRQWRRKTPGCCKVLKAAIDQYNEKVEVEAEA